MSNNSLVSAIIIFQNEEKFLREAIESVLAQTYEHWELLLIDDGSTDNSTEIALNFVRLESSKIHYLEHTGHQNRGMSASRNLGIRHAKGRYIAFLDADDFWLPRKLEVQVGILDSRPDIDMVFGNTKYWFSWSGRAQDCQSDFIPILGIEENSRLDPPLLLPLLLEGKVSVPCTCSLLVRSDAMRRIGGFEDSFPGMYEDQVFYAKICLSVPILATGDCLAWYRQHPESATSVAVKSGYVEIMHYEFLQWLESYCHNHHVRDALIWQTIRRQLWLYDNPVQRIIPGLSSQRRRWVKKWILQAEEALLPRAIRMRLWAGRRKNDEI